MESINQFTHGVTGKNDGPTASQEASILFRVVFKRLGITGPTVLLETGYNRLGTRLQFVNRNTSPCNYICLNDVGADQGIIVFMALEMGKSSIALPNFLEIPIICLVTKTMLLEITPI